MSDTSVEHISATCHHETYVFASLEHLGCCLDEIFRTFLIGNTTEEGNNLLLYVSFDFELLASAEVNCVMYCYNL